MPPGRRKLRLDAEQLEPGLWVVKGRRYGLQVIESLWLVEAEGSREATSIVAESIRPNVGETP